MSDSIFIARRARRLPFVMLAAAPPPATAATPTTGIPAWNLASADLPADPTVRFGVLPNGMR